MSDEAPAPKKKKGGKMKTLLLGLVGVTVLVGGGIGAGLYAAGAGLVGGAHGPVEDPNRPKLVLKDGGEESSNSAAAGKNGEGHVDAAKYKASFYTMEQPFTSNLRDSDGFVQLGLGVSTFYDARVLDNLKNNEMPVRSAVLLTLANQDAFVLATPEGKEKLQEELREAINGTLIKREGFGGIDSVYFTSFIIQ